MLKYQVCLAVPHFGYTNCSLKQIFCSIEYPPKTGQGTFYEMNTNIERTGNLSSDGGFVIFDSHFDGSCFTRHLKVIILALSCLKMLFVPFLKN